MGRTKRRKTSLSYSIVKSHKCHYCNHEFPDINGWQLLIQDHIPNCPARKSDENRREDFSSSSHHNLNTYQYINCSLCYEPIVLNLIDKKEAIRNHLRICIPIK